MVHYMCRQVMAWEFVAIVQVVCSVSVCIQSHSLVLAHGNSLLPKVQWNTLLHIRMQDPVATHGTQYRWNEQHTSKMRRSTKIIIWIEAHGTETSGVGKKEWSIYGRLILSGTDSATDTLANRRRVNNNNINDHDDDDNKQTKPTVTTSTMPECRGLHV